MSGEERLLTPQRADELKDRISRLKDAEARIRVVRQDLETEARKLTEKSILHRGLERLEEE